MLTACPKNAQSLWSIIFNIFNGKKRIYSLSAISAKYKNMHICAPPSTKPLKNREIAKCNGYLPNIKNSQLTWKINWRIKKKCFFIWSQKNEVASKERDRYWQSLTNCGNPIKKIVCLVPMIVTTKPKKQFPVSAPNDIADAIHDKSLNDNLPLSNGVASDRSNGNAMDNQPFAQPKLTMIKLASFSIIEYFALVFMKYFKFYQRKKKISQKKSPDIAAKYCEYGDFAQIRVVVSFSPIVPVACTLEYILIFQLRKSKKLAWVQIQTNILVELQHRILRWNLTLWIFFLNLDVVYLGVFWAERKTIHIWIDGRQLCATKWFLSFLFFMLINFFSTELETGRSCALATEINQQTRIAEN